MKNIVIASDSFKGTLSSQDIINIAHEVVNENNFNVKITPFLIADGGEGTVEAFKYNLQGRTKEVLCHDANYNTIKASYFIYEKTAVIEVASCIYLVNTKIKNPFYKSSYGVGELILDALKEGVDKIIIGLGGSSTNDAGAPILKALGAKFYTKDNVELLDLSNHNLSLVDHIELDEFNKIINGKEFIIMCDVTNPLLGINGATYVYSKQKGASESDFPILEANLEHYARICNYQNASIEGTGAAGGIGYCFITFFNATLKSGINVLLDMIEFDKYIHTSDIFISGEGRLDEQSFNGKVIDGILKRLEKYNKKLDLIVGCIKNEQTLEEIHKRNVDNVIPTSQDRKDFASIVLNARSDYKKAFKNLIEKKLSL